MNSGTQDAEVARADLADALEVLQHEFKCGICLSFLTDPESLPCNHFFCRLCVKQLKGDPKVSNKLSCPTCKHPFKYREPIEDPLVSALVARVRRLDYLIHEDLDVSTMLSQMPAPTQFVRSDSKRSNTLPQFSPALAFSPPVSQSSQEALPVESIAKPTSTLLSEFEQVRSVTSAADAKNSPPVERPAPKRKPSVSVSETSTSMRRSNSVRGTVLNLADAAPTLAVAQPSTADPVLAADTCMICFEAFDKKSNSDSDTDAEDDHTIACSSCSLISHAACYGLDHAAPLNWKCLQCRQRGGKQTCLACPGTLPGMKPTTDGRWIHICCALWIPEVSFVDPDTREPCNVLAIPEDRFKMKCCICKTKNGAIIQCSFDRCRTAFHVSCGQLHDDYKFEFREVGDDLFQHCYCPQHAAKSHKVKACNSDPSKRRRLLEMRDSISPAAEADANLPKGKRPVTATSKGSSDMTPKTNTKGNQPRVSPPLPVAAAAAAVGIGQVHPGELSWMVLCGTSLNADQETEMNSFVRRFGGRVDAEFSDDTTHVITKASSESKFMLPSRPLKYFYGILRGKWVLSFEWLSKCLSVGHKVDEAIFQVRGDQTAMGAPEKARRLISSHRPLLFEHLTFAFHSDFDLQERVRHGFELLLNWGGGRVVGTLPDVAAARTYLVTHSPRANIDSTMIGDLAARNISVVDMATLLDSVSKYDARTLIFASE